MITLLEDSVVVSPPQSEPGFGALESPRGCFPLAAMEVLGRITGLVYRIEVAQTFQNPFSEPLEATYIFPLPDRSGVVRFQLQVGERVVEGRLRERGEARREYDQALRQGYRAAIAEEERSDVFTIRAGNIPPGEEVRVRLELGGPLPVSDGEATFFFPLVVAPRYIPGRPLPGPCAGSGTSQDTTAVPDASRITPPVLLKGQPNPVRLRLQLELDPAGLSFRRLRSSLHTVQLESRPGGVRVVSLRPDTERLDRDFVLRFQVGGDAMESGICVLPDDDGREATWLATLVPPSLEDCGVRPRDLVVLLDVSGSMEGWKITAAARAAAHLIEGLTEHDRFCLLVFNHTLRGHGARALEAATDRARFRAAQWLTGVTAEGGTELAGALAAALGCFGPAGGDYRERALALITDGQVGDEQRVLDQLRRAGSVRIFAVGVDRAVSAGLLGQLAHQTGGTVDLVESEGRLEEALRSLHRRIGNPVLTDLRVEGLETVEVTPQRCDVFPGVPAVLHGRCRSWSGGAVTLRAFFPGGAEYCVQVVPSVARDPIVHTVWARARVLDLEHEFAVGREVAADIVRFSLRWGVLSRFTAFVAVDRAERAVAAGEPVHRVTQPVEQVSGWEAVSGESGRVAGEAPRRKGLLRPSGGPEEMQRRPGLMPREDRRFAGRLPPEKPTLGGGGSGQRLGLGLSKPMLLQRAPAEPAGRPVGGWLGETADPPRVGRAAPAFGDPWSAAPVGGHDLFGEASDLFSEPSEADLFAPAEQTPGPADFFGGAVAPVPEPAEGAGLWGEPSEALGAPSGVTAARTVAATLACVPCCLPRASLASPEPADPVDCTVFAPPEAWVEDPILVQVFAHVPEAAEAVRAMAREFDEEASRRGVTSLPTQVRRGSRLTFLLEMPGSHIREELQELTWTGRPASVQFEVVVLPGGAGRTLIGKVTVLQDRVPIGHIRFKLKVRAGPGGASQGQPAGEANRYRYAFISYASADRPEVIKRVQLLATLGIDFFQDVLSLGPGERWERRIYENIDRADVFYLFWSRAARASEWVRRELRYALARKQGREETPPEIYPVPIEHPIAPPPEELGHLHFNDRLLYFLQGAQAALAAPGWPDSETAAAPERGAPWLPEPPAAQQRLRQALEDYLNGPPERPELGDLPGFQGAYPGFPRLYRVLLWGPTRLKHGQFSWPDFESWLALLVRDVEGSADRLLALAANLPDRRPLEEGLGSIRDGLRLLLTGRDPGTDPRRSVPLAGRRWPILAAFDAVLAGCRQLRDWMKSAP